jgi:glycosyltransferase involved in cell wall biosynthesis
VVVIANGVELEAFSAKRDRAALERRWPACIGKRVALFLSRLHPIKGADLLVDAWGLARSSKVLKCESSKVGPCQNVGVRESEDRVASTDCRTENWHLLIAGPDELGTLQRLREQVQRLGLEGSVTFCGPLYGAERAAALAAADLFVLPTRNENFGIVVAEALASGTPVITTKGAPWAELLGRSASSKVLTCESSKVGEAAGVQSAAADGSQQSQDRCQNNCRTFELPNFRTVPDRSGWWVEVGAEPLAAALTEAMSLTDEERRAMGENGRRLVEAKYQWPMIAKAMEKVYGGCVRSSKVREY